MICADLKVYRPKSDLLEKFLAQNSSTFGLKPLKKPGNAGAPFKTVMWMTFFLSLYNECSFSRRM